MSILTQFLAFVSEKLMAILTSVLFINTLLFLYYPELLGYFASLILRLVARWIVPLHHWHQWYKARRKRKQLRRKEALGHNGVGAGRGRAQAEAAAAVAEGISSEWSIATQPYRFFREARKHVGGLPLLTFHHTVQVKGSPQQEEDQQQNQQQQDSTRHEKSVTEVTSTASISSLRIASINLSPYLLVEGPNSHKTQRYLFGCSIRGVSIRANGSIKLSSRGWVNGDDDTDDETKEEKCLAWSLDFYMGGMKLYFISISIIRNFLYRIFNRRSFLEEDEDYDDDDDDDDNYSPPSVPGSKRNGNGSGAIGVGGGTSGSSSSWSQSLSMWIGYWSIWGTSLTLSAKIPPATTTQEPPMERITISLDLKKMALVWDDAPPESVPLHEEETVTRRVITTESKPIEESEDEAIEPLYPEHSTQRDGRRRSTTLKQGTSTGSKLLCLSSRGLVITVDTESPTDHNKSYWTSSISTHHFSMGIVLGNSHRISFQSVKNDFTEWRAGGSSRSRRGYPVTERSFQTVGQIQVSTSLQQILTVMDWMQSSLGPLIRDLKIVRRARSLGEEGGGTTQFKKRPSSFLDSLLIVTRISIQVQDNLSQENRYLNIINRNALGTLQLKSMSFVRWMRKGRIKDCLSSESNPQGLLKASFFNLSAFINPYQVGGGQADKLLSLDSCTFSLNPEPAGVTSDFVGDLVAYQLMDVQLGSISLKLNDAKQVDNFIRVCTAFRKSMTFLIFNRRAPTTSATIRKQTKVKQLTKVDVECNLIQAKISLLNVCDHAHIDIMDHSETQDFLVYRAAIRKLRLRFDPSRSIDKSSSKRGMVSVQTSETLVSLDFTPHRNLPLYPYSIEKSFNVNDSQYEEEKEKFITEIRNRRVQFSARASNFGFIIWPPERNMNMPPEIDFEMDNLMLKEHVSWSHQNEAGSKESDILHSPSPVHLSIMSEASSSNVLRTIDIRTTSDSLALQWSPVLQWFIQSVIVQSEDSLRYYLQFIRASTSGSNKRSNTVLNSVHIQTRKGSDINIRATLGGGSFINLLTDQFILELSHSVNDTWKKPNVTVALGVSAIYLNDSDFPVISMKSFRFEDKTRLALAHEIDEYSRKANGNQSILEEVESDFFSQPLFATILLDFGTCISVNLPPLLHFGKIIDDVVSTQKALGVGLRTANIIKSKPVAKKKYQLMSIIVEIPNIIANFLEYNEPNGDVSEVFMALLPKSRFGKSKDCSSLLQRWRFDIKGISVTIRRLTPPLITQKTLQKLDNDKQRTYIYGPMVQGGHVSIKIARLICVLHPLSIATPLAYIENFSIDGVLYLTSLSQSNQGLMPGRQRCIPVHSHHDSSPAGQFLWHYGVKYKSDEIPVKIYHDLSFHSGLVHSTFGNVVQKAMPKLMNIISRLIPTPPIEEPNRPHPSKHLQWWDNLRNQFHGNFRWKMEELSFRWLLDSVPRYDWSILVSSKDIMIEHSVGEAQLKMRDVIVSVPDNSYHMLNFDCSNTENSRFQKQRDCGRHSLLLIPNLRILFGFEWEVSQPESVPTSHHHSIYISSSMSSTPTDKFEHFRSHGWKIMFDLQLYTSKSAIFSNWLALRADVLPWLTHKFIDVDDLPLVHENSFSSDTPVSDEIQQPGPLPKITGIEINASISNIKIAAWFEENALLTCNDDEKKSFDDDFLYDSEGIYLTIPELQYTYDESRRKKYILNGEIQAALLDIVPTQFDNQLQVSSTLPHPESKECDFDDFSSFVDQMRCHDESLAMSLLHSYSSFENLQSCCHQIKYLDYLLFADQIVIIDKALEEIRQEGGTSEDDSRQKNSVAERNQVPWTVLVAGLRLLWTLEIRDSMMSIVKDILFSINLMQVNSRGTPQTLKEEESISEQGSFYESSSTYKPSHSHDTNTNDHPSHVEYEAGAFETVPEESDSNSNVYVFDTQNERNIQESTTSDLDYLLQPSSDVNTTMGSDESTSVEKPRFRRVLQRQRPTNAEIKKASVLADVIPTFDLRLANPQFQFHSESTGGSMILSIRGAYIQGKKFVKLLAKKKSFEMKDFRSETLLRKTEFMYALDRMELFSWSKSIDVDSGLQWLKVNHVPKSYGSAKSKYSGMEQPGQNNYPQDLYLHETEEFIIPALCKKIMEHCTFNVTQRFHRPPVDLTKEELDEAIERNKVISLETEGTMDHISIMVDELSFLLDSYQFSTTLNVIRTVLLAPPQHRRERYYGNPSKPEKKKLNIGHVTEGVRKEMVDILKRHGNSASLDKKQSKTILQSKAREILDDLEEKQEKSHRRRTRRIEYTLCKAKWKVKTIDSTDNSELNLTWFRGTHDFTVDGSVNSQLFLEDLQITTQNPDHRAVKDYDPTIILKTEVGVERSSCQKCGQPFDRRENESSSCVFHSGIYTSSLDGSFRKWTCCQAKEVNAVGCLSRPHTGIENFLAIRVDCYPKTVEGMTFYSHIEANVYPGFPHTITAQVTKTAVDFFRGYFIGDNDSSEVDGSKRVDMNNRKTEAVDQGHSDLGNFNDLASVSSNSTYTSTHNLDDESSGTKSLRRDSDTSYITELPTLAALSASRTLPRMASSTSTLTTRTLSSETSRTLSGSEPSQYPVTDTSEADNKLDTYDKRNLLFGKAHNLKADKSNITKKSRQTNDEKSSARRNEKAKRRKKSGDQVEIFFVKHLRVGEINLQASLTEFLISVKKANFTSTSYEQAYQIGDWSHLINQYLREHFHTLAPQALNELFMKRKMILGKSNESTNEAQERRDRKDGITPPVTPEHILFGASKEKKKRRGAFGRRKGD